MEGTKYVLLIIFLVKGGKSAFLCTDCKHQTAPNRQILEFVLQGCNSKHVNQDDLINHVNVSHIKCEKDEEYICQWEDCPRKGKGFSARYAEKLGSSVWALPSTLNFVRFLSMCAWEIPQPQHSCCFVFAGTKS